MFANFSLAALTSTLSELTEKVTESVSSVTLDDITHTATALTTSISHTLSDVIEQTKSEFQQEEAKITELKKEKENENELHTKSQHLSPWFVDSEHQSILEPELKARVLKLSYNPSTFLTNISQPSADTDADGSDDAGGENGFDWSMMMVYAERALLDDPMLERARYRLVPRRITEQKFWENYFRQVNKVRAQMGVRTLGDVASNVKSSTAGSDVQHSESRVATVDSTNSHSDAMTSIAPSELPVTNTTESELAEPTPLKSSLNIAAANESAKSSVQRDEQLVELDHADDIHVASDGWASDDFVAIPASAQGANTATAASASSATSTISSTASAPTVTSPTDLKELETLLDDIDASDEATDPSLLHGDDDDDDALLAELEKELP